MRRNPTPMMRKKKMRHKKNVAKLGRDRAHRKALVTSLVRSLILYNRITTTLPKAKAAQRLTERLLNRGKRTDVAARRYAYSYLNDHKLVKRLFDEIAPRFADKSSGFTRIFLLGNRPGDGAQMAVLEMTVKDEEPKKTSRLQKTTGSGKKTPARQSKSKASGKGSAEVRKTKGNKKQSDKK
ncbi:50S ribosomal protein L17 [candidate division WOR-3 bacterium]|uniref:Large ribosomal subunit protein bL17 n=1 Tax=candidate division WOR-3 bacterium TaxID=2052148 RepID=A0A9D5KDQ1_UNCW3|nr:50S ribosomal protein L17 [candidate division WOR-3 bacterium]MBD3365631.1 50S ribosomal protein L17 [candidate division WOR-3 bacterium]